MKYFNPSYWLKMWVLSAPLFNDKTQVVYAKSINNKNIKDWASENTKGISALEQQKSNFTNATEFINYQTHLDTQNLGRNLSLDTSTKTSLNVEVRPKNDQQAILWEHEFEEQHHHDLQAEHNRHKRNDKKRKNKAENEESSNSKKIKDNNNLSVVSYVDLTFNERINMANPITNTLNWFKTLSSQRFMNNMLNHHNIYQTLINNYSQNYGFTILLPFIFASQNAFRERLRFNNGIFPYSVVEQYRNNILVSNIPNNPYTTGEWLNFGYLTLFSDYAARVANRMEMITGNNVNNLNNLAGSATLATRLLNEIVDEAYSTNNLPSSTALSRAFDTDRRMFNYRFHNHFLNRPLLCNTDEKILTSLNDYSTNILVPDTEHYVMVNRVRQTFNQVFSLHFYNLIRNSISLGQPFIFFSNINNFPPQLFTNLISRQTNNYFMIISAIEDRQNYFYEVFDPINRQVYRINGNHFLSIVTDNTFHFIFLYNNARSTALGNHRTVLSVREVYADYANFLNDNSAFQQWAQRILSWILLHDNIELNCDDFEKFKKNLSNNSRKQRELPQHDECIINQDSWYLKLINEKIYYIFTINTSNKDNTRKKGEMFVSTDKGFYFINLDHEIFKINGLKNITNIISDNQGSVYIKDESEKNYHINLYDFGYTEIKCNTILNDQDLQKIIENLPLVEGVVENQKMPIITTLHIVQKKEYSDNTHWTKNDIFVGTDKGIYFYSPKEIIIDKFTNLSIIIKDFTLNKHSAYAVTDQGFRISLDLFSTKGSYEPLYKVMKYKDFVVEQDVWFSTNNKIAIHISRYNVMMLFHSFLYNKKENFVDTLLEGYFKKLNISWLFTYNEEKNIAESIWNNFPDFHEKSLSIGDHQSLVLHIDGQGNWWTNENIWLENNTHIPTTLKKYKNILFTPQYEFETSNIINIVPEFWTANEVKFKISHYNIRQIFKSFIYSLKQQFINDLISGFLKKLIIKQDGDVFHANFYDVYYHRLAETIYQHFSYFHEKSLLVNLDQALYFDMYASENNWETPTVIKVNSPNTTKHEHDELGSPLSIDTKNNTKLIKPEHEREAILSSLFVDNLNKIKSRLNIQNENINKINNEQFWPEMKNEKNNLNINHV